MDGVLTGTVNTTETALYPDGVGLTGAANGESFLLISDVFTSVMGSRTVTQTFTLDGHLEDGGDVIKAVYTATITNLLPDAIIVQGSFNASRPSMPGSERLLLETDTRMLPLGASLNITATLLNSEMRLIAETRPITFTAQLGMVNPVVTDTVNGEAVTTFTAGQTLGQATIYATTGLITSTLHIQLYATQPPVANFTTTTLTGTVPFMVNFIDLTIGGATSWLWDFGDGVTSTQQNPSHTYNFPGTYTVTLTVWNSLGENTLAKEDFIMVTEAEECKIYIPLVIR